MHNTIGVDRSLSHVDVWVVQWLEHGILVVPVPPGQEVEDGDQGGEGQAAGDRARDVSEIEVFLLFSSDCIFPLCIKGFTVLYIRYM